MKYFLAKFNPFAILSKAIVDGLFIQNQTNHRNLMAKLSQLIEEVAQTKTAVASALALIKGLAAQLEEAQDDPEEIQDLIDELNETQDELAAAVVENTPKAPVEPTE